jgi:hypothetical protein
MLTSFPWQVESLRLTRFTTGTIDQPDSLGKSLWEQITGSPPSNRIEHTQQSIKIEEGSWNKGKLTVKLQPGRVDIIYNALPTPGLPSIGDINSALEIFRKLLNVQNVDANITRIGFGVILLHPEESQATAYETLAKLLPNIKVDPNSSDFLYQINLPKKLESNISINRLCRWSAISIYLINITQADLEKNQLFATRLELDINTSTNTSLSSESDINALEEELISCALRIASRGDYE